MKYNKIEEKLLEILLSYDKYNDVYEYMNVVIDFHKRGTDKKNLTDILTKILSEIDDKYENQENQMLNYGVLVDILGTVLDYLTKFCLLPDEDSPEGKFYYYFEEKK